MKNLVFRSFPDPSAFAQSEAYRYLIKNKDFANIQIGIIKQLLADLHAEQKRFPIFFLASVEEEDGTVLVVATRTPPHFLLISKISPTENTPREQIVEV